jgi:hypothetical protein
MRRAVVLLALLGAVLLVYSAPMAQAAINKVRCTTDPSCTGTNGADRLIDEADSFTKIQGGGGDDTYVERSGSSDSADTLWDNSTTTTDTYYISNDHFNTAAGDALWISDWGGSKDLLDLSPTGYSSSDCDPSPTDARGDGSSNDLYIDCPGRDNIVVFDYYTTNSIEKFKFTDGTFVGPSKSGAASTNSATTQEHTTAQKQAPEAPPDMKHSGQVSSQAEKNASRAGSWGRKSQ